jgi:KUP system potassium uptake protein
MASSSNANTHAHGHNGHGNVSLFGLMVGAIGVVFGDIGTSPLYTIKEAFIPHYGLTPDHATVMGVLSLVFWALVIVVTLKYVSIIMRADNEGEGGIMALMALAQRTLPKGSRSAYAVGILGIFGASLFFGDGVITPAVSVLSALEGIEVAAPKLQSLDRAAAVLICWLFHDPALRDEKVAKSFGPITALWFASLAAYWPV